ncbi:MAG: hypothetical protein U0894_09765 [Pirellulales bacterium]
MSDGFLLFDDGDGVVVFEEVFDSAFSESALLLREAAADARPYGTVYLGEADTPMLPFT